MESIILSLEYLDSTGVKSSTIIMLGGKQNQTFY
jgi:hypothetical protein